MSSKDPNWMREYMRNWRAANQEKCRAYKKRARERQRECQAIWRCRGDGFEVDPTGFIPEESSAWSGIRFDDDRTASMREPKFVGTTPEVMSGCGNAAQMCAAE